MAELAKELEVTRGWLTAAFTETGLAFPTLKERMLEAARAEVADGGTLSDPANAELRTWLRQRRSKRRRGIRSADTDILDALDPDWVLNARDRTEGLGLEFRAHSHRKRDAYWQQGLERAGWSTTEEAAEWMVTRGASTVAVAAMMGVPESTASARIRPITPGYRVPGETSGTLIAAPLRALVGHLRSGGTVDDVPDEIRAWLDGRVRESRDAWVNALLDDLVPGWSGER